MAFDQATIDIRPRLLISLDGQPGTGRTRFALSAPRPSWVIELDRGGMEGVLEDATDVNVAHYAFRKNMTQEDAKEIANEVEQDIIDARDAGRSLVIDKANNLWQLFRLAEFGRLAGVRQRNFEAVNTRMSELLQSFVDSDTSLILIHDLADEWVDDKVVGKKRGGFNGVEGIVRHAATFSGGRDGLDFSAMVTRCTPNWPFVGTVFGADDLTFANYAAQAVPQLPPETWL